MPPETTGAEFKRLRRQLLLTQEQAGVLCEVDTRTVSRWEQHRAEKAHTRQVPGSAVRLLHQILDTCAREAATRHRDVQAVILTYLHQYIEEQRDAAVRAPAA